MERNVIRSIIFLVAGLVLLFFPKYVMKMQEFVAKKLYRTRSSSPTALKYMGIAFLIVAVVLFLYATN
ncbi:MAG: hypothetical protein QF486_00560 [Candidatus Woesearchaeota archaeon]|jgi:hypothetical protein|nr:hypothetical protein [Candidatus Woesearchaeota archaeon]MDP7198095.1 hypothetical protein [Candidatus Woesearchaeota archaeon]MDP7466929.1 hypothetical protein [Candidatus Woesearchaeota archaeon]MDP7647364.1 hypothetical protein [Candidatus Woesearchaeota archaeon]